MKDFQGGYLVNGSIAKLFTFIMSSSITETTTPVVPVVEEKLALKGLERRPLELTGALDAFESFDVTPVIGREFPNANLKDFLRAPNSDDLLRDLAVTSQYPQHNHRDNMRYQVETNVQNSLSERSRVFPQARRLRR